MLILLFLFLNGVNLCTKVQAMELSDDQLAYLMDQKGHLDDLEDFFSSVYLKKELFLWPNGDIPYEFHHQKVFDDSYQTRVEKVIDALNLMLQPCVKLR